MKRPIPIILLALFFSISSSAFSQKLAEVHDFSPEEKGVAYQILKDVSYGSDAEQTMDIYLSQKAKSFGKRNYTIVFLHGGGYYFNDKRQEERYIEPYLKKGLNIVNLNYRLKRGIPLATSDLTHALNFLAANKGVYDLNLGKVVVTGFSAGAHIATNVAFAQNNPEYPDKLDDGIRIVGVINFSGPVDGLDVVERVFTEHENEQYKAVGRALFPAEGYESKENLAIYQPITYFDPKDPPIFLWHGGLDDQIPAKTFERFVPLMRTNKDLRIYLPESRHSPTKDELEKAYIEIFRFLDGL
ncbi:alpha/beta hydrolase [Mariniradius sediminis]|uniref:Alpha/beta hydrolase n=1 Tax=Mariniradius sediminis TaxID=2909237 RepID=A0ABS9BYR6_9BACT|nr:alpha/beta hydrolase [Mariniradius sediminis]MCF1753204.1 alpha/beta hydrolase [Mariniradius sediminis]